MSTVACPHCSQPIENDPSLAGSAALCPHCDGEFQFPEAAKAPAKRQPAAAAARQPSRSESKASRRSEPEEPVEIASEAPALPERDSSPRSRDKAKSTGKEKPSTKEKTTGQQKLAGKKSSGKGKSAGKENGSDDQPAKPDLKTLALRAGIGVAAAILLIGVYFYATRRSDYASEKRVVLSHIAKMTPKVKFDSWHGDGPAKGCTSTTGDKIPENGILLRAFVTTVGRMAYKKDIVFVVSGGKVTNEIEWQNFRLPGASAKNAGKKK